MYDSRQCTGIKILKVFPAGHGCAVTGRLFCLLPPAPQCEFKYLSLGLLIKLAYTATKYQCTPLRVHELVADRTPLVQEGDGGAEVGGGGVGQVPTGQTVSERRRGSVTYCFTETLPDLLGVKARSSLVLSHGSVRGICLHPLSQFHTEEAQCGRLTQAVSPGRWGPSLTRVPRLRPGPPRQTQTEALYCSTGPQNRPFPWDPRVGTGPWHGGPYLKRWSTISAKTAVLISRRICF